MINDTEHDPRVVHVPGTPEDEDESLIVAPSAQPRGCDRLPQPLSSRAWSSTSEDLEQVKLFANHVAIALETLRSTSG